MKLRLCVILLTFLTLAASCAKKFDDNTIAYIDGKRYTLDHLSDYYSSSYVQGLSADVLKERIDTYIKIKLSELYLEDNNRLDDFMLKYKIKTWEARQDAQALFDKAVFNYLISPDVYDNLYNRLKSEKLTSHILISFKGAHNSSSDRTEDEALRLTRRIRAQINENNFESLAKQYSEDPATRDQGGDLGWVSAGKMIAVFDSALYATPTSFVSGPVKTEYGYHLIYPRQERSVMVKSKEEELNRLKILARKTWNDRFIERQKYYIDSLATANPITIRLSAVEDFYTVFDSIYSNSNKPDVFQALLAMPDTFKLAEYPGTTVDKQWVIDYMAFFMDRKDVPKFNSPADLNAFIKDNHMLDLLVREGAKLDYKKSDSFQQEKRRYVMRTSHAYYTSVVVYEGLEPTDDEIARYYVRNKEKYMTPEKVRVQEILVSDSLLAEEIFEKLQKGSSFADMAEKYTERPIGKRNKGLLTPFQKGQFGAMGKHAFTLAPGETGRPVKVEKNQFSIVNLIEIIPETPIAFDLVKNQVRNHILEERMKSARQDSFKKLYETYKVQVNPLYEI
jgi:parvulin-like peptidyl-prolyl isomerase